MLELKRLECACTPLQPHDRSDIFVLSFVYLTTDTIIRVAKVLFPLYEQKVGYIYVHTSSLIWPHSLSQLLFMKKGNCLKGS